jgi:hypothetical protein
MKFNPWHTESFGPELRNGAISAQINKHVVGGCLNWTVLGSAKDAHDADPEELAQRDLVLMPTDCLQGALGSTWPLLQQPSASVVCSQVDARRPSVLFFCEKGRVSSGFRISSA